MTTYKDCEKLERWLHERIESYLEKARESAKYGESRPLRCAEILAQGCLEELEKLPAVAVEEVQGKMVCDPLTVDKPESIGPEVRRKAREALMEALEAKGLIRYQMLNGILYTGVQVVAPEKKT